MLSDMSLLQKLKCLNTITILTLEKKNRKRLIWRSSGSNLINNDSTMNKKDSRLEYKRVKLRCTAILCLIQSNFVNSTISIMLRCTPVWSSSHISKKNVYLVQCMSHEYVSNEYPNFRKYAGMNRCETSHNVHWWSTWMFIQKQIYWENWFSSQLFPLD